MTSSASSATWRSPAGSAAPSSRWASATCWRTPPGSPSSPTPATTSSTWAQGLPRSRHAHLHPRGACERGDRLGQGRGERRLHGGPRRARRRDLVLPRRQGPRHARRADPAAPCRREPERGHRGPVRKARRPGAHRAHERRSGADRRRDAGRPARLPALFRARAVYADRAGLPPRGGRAGAALRGVHGRPGGARSRRRRHLPVEPLHQHRPDPRGPRRPCRTQGVPGAGDRRLPDRRRAGGQGTDRQDDGGARHRAQRRRHRRALRRPDRRARDRRGRPGAGGRHRRHRRRRRGHGHDDDEPSRQAGPRPRGARVRREDRRGEAKSSSTA